MGGTIVTAAATGCCPRRYPLLADRISDAIHPASPFLRCKPIAKPPGAPPCIDVHAHFFNASDVPVRDYLARCVAGDISDSVRELAVLLSKTGIAEFMAGFAPSASAELSELLTIEEEAKLGRKDVASLLEEKREKYHEYFAEELVKELRKHPEVELRYRDLKQKELGLDRSAARRIHLTASQILAAARENANAAVPLHPSGMTFHTDGIFGFILYMCSMRWMNLTAYCGSYSANPGAFGVDTVLGGLVDFDHWLKCPPVSTHRDQIRLHAILSRASGGYMRPLLAYNPRTDLEECGASLQRLREFACRDHMFVGVKVYPPIGYKPTDNLHYPKLDPVMEQFFEFCAEQRLPVLTHSSQSKAARARYSSFGSPSAWDALLKKHSTRANVPTINLGHFGGAGARRYVWQPRNNWTSEFAELMAKPEGRELFADLGFWEGLHNCQGSNEGECRAAKERLATASDVHGGVAKRRLMFGTDWAMLATVKGWPRYPFSLAKELNGMLPLDDFFGLNAMRCFNRLASTSESACKTAS